MEGIKVLEEEIKILEENKQREIDEQKKREN